ncbi:hypothetical protein C6P46_003346 [Rhodotorula mucilaginosa]|uniref:BTB domain-containing protein n=1 Tax=Rhodotorula mucilaginosa TaxID=5537 RepID=A0A9P6W4I0_RHOMI|nr:hypothetical protein C6P46_003346 [Rhodotorula mucilaginosa]
MADSSAAEDIITLVTSNDPPVELRVERTKLLDSSVFNDMFSLPTTGDGAVRVNVAETAGELETWLDFLRSGKVETSDPAGQCEPSDIIGFDVVRIAKLVDKHARLLVERSTHPIFIVLASEHIKADRVQRHATAETLARRAQEGAYLEDVYTGSGDKFDQWVARTSEWQDLLVPARNRFIIERSRRYNHDKLCEDCQPGVADVWRELLLAAGHDKNPIDSFTRTLRSYPASPRRICPLHRDEFYDTLRALDQDVRL